MSLLDKVNEALDDSDAPSVSAVATITLPPIYYDGRSYYVPAKKGRWVTVDRQSLVQHLIRAGYDAKKEANALQSEVNELIVRIQTEHNVDYCGAVAGYVAGVYEMNGNRVLVTSSPKFLVPIPGAFPVLDQVLGNLLGEKQRPYFHGWLKTALQMYQSGVWRPGQVLCLCGPPNSGKNLLRMLITELCGGRVATPHSFMSGRTIFNRDIVGAETLAIEDQSEGADIRTRRHLGAAIKNISVNRDQRCEGKGRDALMLVPLWRLIISMNDESERVQVLPPLEGDIADKIMLFKVEQHPMPMPTDTPDQWTAFERTLKAELPMFLHFLANWQVPRELQSSRYGVAHYHHPKIAEMLERTAPENQLAEMLDSVLFREDARPEEWTGTAMELQAVLTDEGTFCREAARKLLGHSNTCGTYLGRLESKGAGVKNVGQRHGSTVWRIEKAIDYRAIEEKQRRGR